MSINPSHINLSFSSQDSSFPHLHLPTQLDSYVQESVGDKGVGEIVERSDTKLSRSGLKRSTCSKSRFYLRRKKLRFLRPTLSMLTIPKPLAQGSQLGLFDFPKSMATNDNIEEIITEDGQAVAITDRVDRSSYGLFHQKKTNQEVTRVNKEVVKVVRKLMNELKLIKKKYDKERISVRKEFKYTKWMQLNEDPETQQRYSFLQGPRES